jgi:hypothetical protein
VVLQGFTDSLISHGCERRSAQSTPKPAFPKDLGIGLVERSTCACMSYGLETKSPDMINRNIARIAATLVCLAGWSQASLSAPIRDIGTSCFAQDSNDILDSRSCMAEAGLDFTRGPGICIGRTLRTTSSAAFLTTITTIRTAHQNLCPKSNALVAVSYFLQQARR